jgi:hypothetical protein
MVGTVVAWPAYAAHPVAANAEPVKRLLHLAAACNPCAAKKKAHGCNPCAVRKSACGACNPCAAKKKACGACNPCSAKKTACGACNPCVAKKTACGASNPCGAKRGCNPCGGANVSAKAVMRPCGAGVNPRAVGALVKEGERLWKDSSLSSNGSACNTCHQEHAALNPTFAMTYPYKVAMPLKMAGVNQVNADEMVQFCMQVPMQAKALGWSSRELAALTAYTLEFQKGYSRVLRRDGWQEAATFARQRGRAANHANLAWPKRSLVESS